MSYEDELVKYDVNQSIWLKNGNFEIKIIHIEQFINVV